MMAFDDDQDAGRSLWSAGNAGAVVRRVWYALPAVGIVMVIGALVSGTGRDAAGVAVGVTLAAANLWFLETSLRSLLGSGRAQPPSGSTLMFVVRWILVGMLGYAACSSGAVSGIGVIWGLFAPAMAIFLEAGFQLVAALRDRGLSGND